MTHRPDWQPLAALLVLAWCAQYWTMARSTVPAQDSVRFMAFARAASAYGWPATMTDRNDSPVFPAIVSLVHGAIQVFSSPADGWALSVTWAAALPAVLAVFPLYGILRRAFDRRVALVSTALFCVVPTVARLGADGLSDSTQLLLVLLAVWAWMAAEETDNQAVRWARWLSAGACLGLACLTRIEAAAMAPAMLISASWTSAGKPRSQAGVALAIGLMLWFFPYVATTGKVTPKHSLRFLADLTSVATSTQAAGGQTKPPVESATAATDGIPRSFDPKDLSITSRRYGYAAALAEFFRELPHGWGYFSGLLSIAGVVLMRQSARVDFDLLVGVFLVTYLAALLHYAAGAGYLASRHFLLPSVLTLGWAGVAIVRLMDKLGVVVVTRWPQISPRVVPVVLMLSAALVCLAPHFKPLRTNRLAYRRAGEWLAETAGVGATILDTRQWTALYSGRTTYGADASVVALADPLLNYVVVERLEIERSSSRAQTLRALIARHAVSLVGFTDSGQISPDPEESSVLVYQWNPAGDDRIRETIARRTFRTRARTASQHRILSNQDTPPRLPATAHPDRVDPALEL